MARKREPKSVEQFRFEVCEPCEFRNTREALEWATRMVHVSAYFLECGTTEKEICGAVTAAAIDVATLLYALSRREGDGPLSCVNPYRNKAAGDLTFKWFALAMLVYAEWSRDNDEIAESIAPMVRALRAEAKQIEAAERAKREAA